MIIIPKIGRFVYTNNNHELTYIRYSRGDYSDVIEVRAVGSITRSLVAYSTKLANEWLADSGFNFEIEEE